MGSWWFFFTPLLLARAVCSAARARCSAEFSGCHFVGSGSAALGKATAAAKGGGRRRAPACGLGGHRLARQGRKRRPITAGWRGETTVDSVRFYTLYGKIDNFIPQLSSKTQIHLSTIKKANSVPKFSI